MLNLSSTINEESGFCFGVIYAVQLAEDYLSQNDHLYCLGALVHNDMELQRLKSLGLRIIDRRQLQALKNEVVMIRAHGEAPATYRQARRNGLTLIDASCPVILKLQHRIKRAYEAGETVLIFGNRDHAEVIGLVGQTEGKAIVVDESDLGQLPELPPRVSLFCQTTQRPKAFYRLKKLLENRGIQVDMQDTVCRQVADRNNRLKVFAGSFDKIVFVAGAASSNGKMLFRTCKTVNPNSYFVSSTYDLKPDWFEPYDKVGICGATSTPMWLMEEIQTRLQSY